MHKQQVQNVHQPKYNCLMCQTAVKRISYFAHYSMLYVVCCHLSVYFSVPTSLKNVAHFLNDSKKTKTQTFGSFLKKVGKNWRKFLEIGSISLLAFYSMISQLLILFFNKSYKKPTKCKLVKL